jgi:hypothetical protein
MDIFIGALKSKTIWVAIATILLGALAGPVQQYAGAHPGIAASVVGAVFAFLRSMTTTSLAEKGAPNIGNG